MSTPDLVNLTNQLSPTRDESPQRKTTKILNLQFQQMKAPKQKQNPPSFYYYCKQPGHWNRNCYKFKGFRHLQPSNQHFQHPPNSQYGALRNYSSSSQSSLLISLEKYFFQIGDEIFLVLIDTGATLSGLHPTVIKQPLSWNTKTVQIVGICTKHQEFPVSELIPFCLGPLRDTHHFLLSSSTSVRLLR